MRLDNFVFNHFIQLHILKTECTEDIVL